MRLNMDFDKIIEEVANMYGYSDELVEALKKCVPAMAKGKSKPEVQLLIDTLRRVEIYTFDEQPTKLQIDEIAKSKMDGRNDHVTYKALDLGEYGKNVGAGAYHSHPVFDKEMNIVDRVGFIHITNLTEYSETAKFQGSVINYSHLIHELGHAMAAQQDEFIQSENGDFTQNIGTVSFYNVVNRKECSTEEVGEDGLYLEEALNTIEEERVICEVFGVESINDIPGYVHSVYHGLMSDGIAEYVKQIGILPFSKLRNFKDDSDLRPYIEIIERTEAAQELNNPSYYSSKRAVFDRIFELDGVSDDGKINTRSFFDKYPDVYFNTNIKGSFLQRLNNVLNQIYNFGSIKYNFAITQFKFNENHTNFSIIKNENNVDIYNAIVIKIMRELYDPLRQARAEIEHYSNDKNQISIASLAKQAIECNPKQEEFQACQIRETSKDRDSEKKEVEQ